MSRNNHSADKSPYKRRNSFALSDVTLLALVKAPTPHPSFRSAAVGVIPLHSRYF